MSNSVRLSVEGMSCGSCASRVDKALNGLDGVEDASVNLASDSAEVTYSEKLSVNDLVQAVKNAGYDAHEVIDRDKQMREQREQQAKEMRTLKSQLWLSTLLTLPVFILAMGNHMLPVFSEWVHNSLGLQTSWWIQLVLTTLVLAVPGARFYKLGVPALFRGAPDMNSLVALGATAAWGYSVVATVFPTWLPSESVNVYFEASAVIVTLILAGRFMEARAKSHTSDAIQRLMSLQSKTARVVRDGEVTEVDIAELGKGDEIEVRPGERIALDGEVSSGDSYVNEAMITGEAEPVHKQKEDKVVGGTLNEKGTLRFKVTATGEGTVLAQIIRMVEQAQGSKLPIQDTVNRITLWFVPAVMLAALLTFVVWYFAASESALTFALVNAVAVLIIACPCAMGLATPTSIMVGTGRGAEMGVLFRQGSALQALQQSKGVIFDKTGTLTEGKPTITEWMTLSEFDEKEVLTLAASIEAKSEHPTAEALVNYAKDQDIKVSEPESFEAISGLGATGKVDGKTLYIGTSELMQDNDIALDAEPADAKAWSESGRTPIYVAIDGKLAAIFTQDDPIKSSAKELIKRLHADGLKTAMVTGDAESTAKRIAKELGIDEVVANVKPDGKVDAVKRLKKQWGQVIFVGDGINDAPALASADVGFAIGTGTDVAIESADVVLMSDNLTVVQQAFALSEATMRNIRQNLFWAFAYNTALIPVAAGVLYPFFGILLSPMLAAGAMALSSVFVITNALRLKTVNLEK
ncbi:MULTISPECIES: heavy metal translocating P-type ATPase [unclassified Idiomarina]|uniref:heavy metal translocating P-type ATPase n=1 Tax=unclassified Idiomarina TaxID=2614829 RepID=UPI0025811205|nr:MULTISPECIES: heavy metal translocating P-type ATPase [unclassified Idiomarina]|tara:strand:- start:19507 stop:21756 length:2250 start_codon:yes stop_codon:yes gene_type:complete